MTEVKIHILLCIFFIGAVLAGCGIGLKGAGSSGSVNNGEDIDPFTYGDEFVQSDLAGKNMPESGETAGSDTNTMSRTMPGRDASEPLNMQSTAKKTDRGLSADVYGYRVQIGIDENKDRMEELEKYARSQVDMEVYMEFEAPFYRVRVGDFRTRKDAEKYVKVLKDKGFKDSLWVITKINPH